VSADRLDLREAASSLTALGREGTHPAGAVVGVLVGGVESVAAAGIAVAGPDEGTPRPMTVGTRFDLASVTKLASTTALAMRLVADGTLDLDEPVAARLPAFAGVAPGATTAARGAAREAVTVRRLLEHTSGLPPWLPLYCRTTDRDEALALAAATPLVSEPGSTWAYSDLGMIVLGAVLEQATGRRQDVAFAQRVAAPLGLSRTGYGPVPVEEAAASADSDVIEHQMVDTGDPYPTDAVVADFGGWRPSTVVGEVSDGNAAHALGGVAGHAGLFATVPELLVLGRSLVDPDVMPEAVVREFTTPQQTAPDQGLGLRLVTTTVAGQRVRFAVHPGFTGTWLAVALDRDLVVAAAATRLHTTTGTPHHPLSPRTDLVTTDEIAAAALAHIGIALGHGAVPPSARQPAPRIEAGAP
jgi:serine-type D-Ala-D-Ala carboxypeptidase